MPESFRAFGVLPPLWSRAAMKPSAFLTLLNCSSFMILVLWLSFTHRHEAPPTSMAQARNGRPFMPTCGQVFAGRGVVVGAPDAGSVDYYECGPFRLSRCGDCCPSLVGAVGCTADRWSATRW